MVVLVALLRIATSLLFWVSASSASRPVELLEKSLTAMGLDVSKLTTSRKRLGPKKNISLTKCASMAQAKNWVFTLNAEEEAGEHTMWPLATQDQHPLGGWVEPGAEMGVKFLCFYNIDAYARFHVFFDKTYVMNGFVTQTDTVILDECKITFPAPIRVQFNNNNGGYASVRTNCLWALSFCGDVYTQTLAANYRVYYRDV